MRLPRFDDLNPDMPRQTYLFTLVSLVPPLDLQERRGEAQLSPLSLHEGLAAAARQLAQRQRVCERQARFWQMHANARNMDMLEGK